MDNKRLVLFSFLFLSICTCQATTKKVLVLSPQVGSHLLQANSIAEGLLAIGHEVYTIIDVTLKLQADIFHRKVHVLRYDNGIDVIFDTPEYQKPLMAMELEDMSILERLNAVGKLFQTIDGECHRVLGNNDLFEKLQQEKFDFVVTDGLIPCFAIIPYRLGVPFATFQSMLPIGIPHAALQGALLIRGPFDSLLTSEDAPAVLATLAKVILVLVITQDASHEFSQYSNKSVFDLQKESKLWLYDKGLVFDNPVPVSPNVIYVGGLNIRRPKPLPDGELKRFTDSAEDGFILVCFGSFAKHFPEWMLDTLVESFGDIPHRIVWKWDKSSLQSRVVPRNVLVVDWIAQNDILGHPNLRLYITHCGNSGQHEALYNGVPMLAIPLFGDQKLNAKQMAERHFGLYIRLKDLTKTKLVAMVKVMIADRSFSERIGAASKIFRDQPMESRQTAAYWIDHVMKYGADHLQSATNEMPWYRILMMDVLLVVCVAFFIVCMLFCCVCRLLIRRCSEGHCYECTSKAKTKMS